MKIIVTLLILLSTVAAAVSQPCTIDTSYHSYGVWPTDTLDDIHIGSPFSQPRQVVVGNEPGIITNPPLLDSLHIIQITHVPAGVSWQCDQAPTCMTNINSEFLGRACVLFSGTPQVSNPAYPNHDSMMVSMTIYFKVGSFPVSITDSMPVFYRTHGPLGFPGANLQQFRTNVQSPVVNDEVKIFLEPTFAAPIHLTVVDASGLHCAQFSKTVDPGGPGFITFPVPGMAPGLYAVRVSTSDGADVRTGRFLKLE